MSIVSECELHEKGKRKCERVSGSFTMAVFLHETTISVNMQSTQPTGSHIKNDKWEGTNQESIHGNRGDRNVQITIGICKQEKLRE